MNIALRSPWYLLASVVLGLLTSCARHASNQNATVLSAVSSGLTLDCAPYGKSGMLARLRGELAMKSRDATGFQVDGPISLTVHRQDGVEHSFNGKMTGHFIPANPESTFQTNYMQVYLSGTGTIEGGSLSFWPKEDDLGTPQSGVYDKDGYRYTMDCSGSKQHFPAL